MASAPRSAPARALVAAAVLALAALLAAAPAAACEFDSDCAPGSRCVKRAGFVYGVCLGGSQPGEDQQPPTDPLDPGGRVGTRCEFDSQCGPGAVCAKDPGSVYGACIRR